MLLFNLTRWPSALILVLAGVVGAAFAFVTVNLFSQAMAAFRFLGEFGTEALRHGALWQVILLIGWGGLTLVLWITFKICEQILEDRYLDWARGEGRTRARRDKAQRREAPADRGS